MIDFYFALWVLVMLHFGVALDPWFGTYTFIAFTGAGFLAATMQEVVADFDESHWLFRCNGVQIPVCIERSDYSQGRLRMRRLDTGEILLRRPAPGALSKHYDGRVGCPDNCSCEVILAGIELNQNQEAK